VSQGIRQIAGQQLYRGELQNGREQVLTAPSACRFPIDVLLLLYESYFLFYSVTSLFRHFSFNFEVVVFGGRILKVCIWPYLHDKDHATKRLGTDVLLFWENAWRNSGNLATILATLLRVISEFVHHNSEGYDDLVLFLHTLHHSFFSCYSTSHKFFS
jgi:hypothetical protein